MFIRLVRIGAAGLAYMITYVMIGTKNHDLFLNTSHSCAENCTASDDNVPICYVSSHDITQHTSRDPQSALTYVNNEDGSLVHDTIVISIPSHRARHPMFCMSAMGLIHRPLLPTPSQSQHAKKDQSGIDPCQKLSHFMPKQNSSILPWDQQGHAILPTTHCALHKSPL